MGRIFICPLGDEAVERAWWGAEFVDLSAWRAGDWVNVRLQWSIERPPVGP
jgi:hypothetical protein